MGSWVRAPGGSPGKKEYSEWILFFSFKAFQLSLNWAFLLPTLFQSNPTTNYMKNHPKENILPRCFNLINTTVIKNRNEKIHGKWMTRLRQPNCLRIKDTNKQVLFYWISILKLFIISPERHFLYLRNLAIIAIP